MSEDARGIAAMAYVDWLASLKARIRGARQRADFH